MISLLENWKGKIEYNDTQYSYAEFRDVFNRDSDDICIRLYPKAVETVRNEHSASQHVFKVTVKQYMTQKATPDFDFMTKWNNDTPMPLRTMVGYKVKETPGMVYMKLHGEGLSVVKCMRCGKELTNPISRYYGIGPSCMAKLGIVCDIEDVDDIKERLQKIEWEGWIIKSAIIEECPVV